MAESQQDKPSALQNVVNEWRGLSLGELAFLIPLALVLVAFIVIEPKGPEQAIPATLVIGVLAGAGIAVSRRRRARR
jgi:uncharacterized membrane protein YczE